MKKSLILIITAAALVSAPAFAERRYEGPAKSRQEAIQRAENRVADLKKMTDAEWTQKRQAVEQRRAERKANRQAAPAPAAAPAPIAPAAR